MRRVVGLLTIAVAVTSAMATISRAAWKIDPDFQPLPSFGFVSDFPPSVEPASDTVVGFLPDGRYYIRGEFTSVSGVFRPGVARLHPNGTLDPTFDPGSGVNPGGSISAGWLQADGKLLLSGWFQSFSGIIRNQLVRLNLDGTVDPGFDAGPAIIPQGLVSSSPDAIAVDAQGRVLRADRGEIRRCASDGSNTVLLATTSHEPYPGQIAAIQPIVGDELMLTGVFTRVGTVERTVLARLHEDGSVDETFDAGLTIPATAETLAFPPIIVFRDPHIYVRSRAGQLVRLLEDGTVDASFVPDRAPPGRGTILTVKTADANSIVIGGRFTHVDGVVRQGIARLQGDGSLDATFDPGKGVAGEVRALAVQADGKILVGGKFVTVAGAPHPALVRFNVDGSLDPSFDAALPPNAVIHAVAVQSTGAIVIGGKFSSVGGFARANLARLLADGSVDPSFTVTTGVTGQQAAVYDIENLDGDEVLVAGGFDAWNGTPRSGIIRLHNNGTPDSTFDPGAGTSGLVIRSTDQSDDGTIFFGGTTASTGLGIFGAIDSAGVITFSVQGQVESEPSWMFESPAVLSDQHGGVIVSEAGNGSDGFVIQPSFLERYDGVGQLDSSLSVELDDGNVLALERHSNDAILAAGDFLDVHGAPAASLVRFFRIPAPDPSTLLNLSTRGFVGQGTDSLIAGFVIEGTESQRVLVRAVGWTLEDFGISSHITVPQIAIRPFGSDNPLLTPVSWSSTSTLGGAHNGRFQNTVRRLGAFTLKFRTSVFPNEFDIAVLLDLTPGAYTAQTTSTTPGIGLVEVYSDPGYEADRKLINISTRGRVGMNDEKLIAGFVIGRGSKRVLIRAVGPGLASYLSGFLANPMFELVRQSDHVTIATNDNWGDAANAADIASVTPQVSGLLLAAGSADAALLVDLPPGAYTVVVSGVGNTTGIALAEVYEVL